uniref:ATP synthase subunit a n=1 Tax=Pseudogarypus banksi TaxID=1131925 RepID=H9MFI6_9ARAC|nr:ATP synthase F0 subunit 6 [Pseudogarypus banksi]
MMNIFSIFDPFPLNFMSIFISFFIFINSQFIKNNSLTLNFIVLFKMINKELKSSIMKSSMSIMLKAITLFVWVMMFNIMGLFPYIFTATSHLILTLSLSLTLMMMIWSFGWNMNTKLLMINLIPKSSPMPLAPFLSLIELIGILIRPLTLSIRLSANMISGHLILSIISISLEKLSKIMFLPLSILLMLEMGVALIQSYVFMSLIILYSYEIY